MSTYIWITGNIHFPLYVMTVDCSYCTLLLSYTYSGYFVQFYILSKPKEEGCTDLCTPPAGAHSLGVAPSCLIFRL